MAWLPIATAVAATIITLAPPDSASGNPPPGEIDVIKTAAEQYERVTVPVTIGGQGPFNFMIDTGAQATVLSRELADRLGVANRKSATLVGIASRAPTEVAQAMEVGLGSRRFALGIVPLVDQANIGSADGILGIDALQDQRVLLDFRNKTFSVADAETLGGNKGYDIVVRARQVLGQLIITNAEIDGVKVAVIVGTGAQGSVGNMALRNRLRGRSAGQATMTDINGVQETSNVQFARSVTIGRVKVSNLNVVFVDSPSFDALGLGDKPAMLLGMNELRLFKRVAIDFQQRKVLFDLPPNSDWYKSAPGS